MKIPKQIQLLLTELGSLENAAKDDKEAKRSRYQRQDMRQQIRAAFEKHHKLKPSKRAATFYYECLGRLFKNQDKDHRFDHLTFYTTDHKDGPALVVVAQPYGQGDDQIEKLAKDWGATHTDITSWSWHYPGRTTGFALTFPRAAVAELRKQARRIKD